MRDTIAKSARFLIVAGLMTCCAISAALAEEPAPGETAQPTIQQILQQQKEIQAALQAGDPAYRYLDPMRRREVYTAQRKVFGQLEGHQDISELSADQQLVVFNALEVIKSTLARRDGDEMICEREKLVGTNRYEMACMTKAERERRAESATRALTNRQACTDPGCLAD